MEKLAVVIPQQRAGCFLTFSCLCAKLTSTVITEEIQELRFLLASKAIPVGAKHVIVVFSQVLRQEYSLSAALSPKIPNTLV